MEIVRLKRQQSERNEEPATLQKALTYFLREAPEINYIFIENHQAESSIKAMRRVINVSQCFRQDCDVAVSDTFIQAKAARRFSRYSGHRLTVSENLLWLQAGSVVTSNLQGA